MGRKNLFFSRVLEFCGRNWRIFIYDILFSKMILRRRVLLTQWLMAILLCWQHLMAPVSFWQNDAGLLYPALETMVNYEWHQYHAINKTSISQTMLLMKWWLAPIPCYPHMIVGLCWLAGTIETVLLAICIML